MMPVKGNLEDEVRQEGEKYVKSLENKIRAKDDSKLDNLKRKVITYCLILGKIYF